MLINLTKGQYNEHQVTAFITVYMMRTITIEELQGFRNALLEMCVPANLDGVKTLDIVGTGGDGKNTFNISTLSCFIVAGAGQPVAKHGNYGATTVSGASNVMEQLGYKFSNDAGKLRQEIEKANSSMRIGIMNLIYKIRALNLPLGRGPELARGRGGCCLERRISSDARA